ncbi:MAG: hypothetical protein AAGE65_09990 [Planctomycetota bacterium]
MPDAWLLQVAPAPRPDGQPGLRWSAELWRFDDDGGSPRPLPTTEADDDLLPWARAVRDTIGPGVGVWVGFNRAWCLPASVSTQGLPRRGRTDLLRFRMEDKLPLPLESLTLGFAHTASHESTLGVALETDVFRGLFDALQEAGVDVIAAVPLALLAASAALNDDTAPMPDVLGLSGLESTDDPQIDWLTLDADGQPMDWISTPTRPTDPSGRRDARLAILLEPLRARLGRSPRLRVLGDVSAVMVEHEPDIEVERPPERSRDALGRAIGQTTRARGAPPAWLDLKPNDAKPRTGLGGTRSAPPWVRAAGFAAAIALGVLALGLFLRAERYEAAAADARTQQEAAYRQVVGDAGAVPTSVVRGLQAIRAEREQNRTSAGANLVAGGSGSSRFSAYNRLQQAVQALPEDVGFAFNRMRFESTAVSLRGRALSFRDADTIAASLSELAPDLDFVAIRSVQADGRDVTIEWEGRPTRGPNR